MALIRTFENKGITKDFTYLDAAGAAITPGVNDEVRATIYREGQTAVLTVASNANGPNGSTFTANTPSSGTNRLVLASADLAFEPGIYTLLLELWDNAAGEWKIVDKQVFQLEETA